MIASYTQSYEKICLVSIPHLIIILNLQVHPQCRYEAKYNIEWVNTEKIVHQSHPGKFTNVICSIFIFKIRTLKFEYAQTIRMYFLPIWFITVRSSRHNIHTVLVQYGILRLRFFYDFWSGCLPALLNTKSKSSCDGSPNTVSLMFF